MGIYRKLTFPSTGPVCEICGKVFTLMHNLVHHRRTIHKSYNIFSCTQCDYTTLQKSNLKCHTKRHSKTPLTSNLPPKIACREPILNITEPTENDQFLRDIEEQELRDMLSSQVGFGVTQIAPADENIPHEIYQFFRDEQPWGTDRNLRQVYVQNFHCIHDSETPQPSFLYFS